METKNSKQIPDNSLPTQPPVQAPTPVIPFTNQLIIPLLILLGLIIISASVFIGIKIGKNQTSNQTKQETRRLVTPIPPTLAPSTTAPTYNYSSSSSTYHDNSGYYYLLTTAEIPTQPDTTQCDFRLVKTPSPTTNFTQAEKLLEFIDCIGSPEKIISVSPDGNIFIFSKERDDGIGLASATITRQDIKYHGFNIPNDNTKITWTNNGISFLGYPSAPWMGTEPEKNKLGTITIPLTDLIN